MTPAGAATSEIPGSGGAPPGRLEAIDIARGAALVAMAVYHFTWDLEHFGYAIPGLTASGGWKLFARAIASTFLFIAGISLVIGHGERIRLRPFLRRTATVAGAALAISIVTWLLFPGSFVFFGILHHIAIAGVVGLAVLRLPASVLAALALVAFIIGNGWQSPVFDPRPAAWIGFSQSAPRSNDFVPLFPWLAASFLGMAAWKAAAAFGLSSRLAAIRAGGVLRPLAAAGRHSLLIYLLHQPILFGLVAL
ncbi:MAG: heparan-alpha-glucosaminide N-acetyltransferase, partial [Rhizobiaceae bacterium]